MEDVNSFYKMKMILINEFSRVFSFRGQKNVNWTLISKVERAYSEWSEKESYKLSSFENHIINTFKRKNPQIWNSVDLNSIVSLLQHYGQPTRLLDFTSDFLMALYFALEADIERTEFLGDSVIWAVRNIDINSSINLEFFDDRIEDKDFKGDFLIESINGKIKKKMIRIISPKFKNPRISVQKGHFICPSNLEYDFESNFFGNFGIDNWDFNKRIVSFQTTNEENQYEKFKNLLKTSFIIKFIIKSEIKEHLIQYLKYHDYTAENIYPKESTIYETIQEEFIQN